LAHRALPGNHTIQWNTRKEIPGATNRNGQRPVMQTSVFTTGPQIGGGGRGRVRKHTKGIKPNNLVCISEKPIIEAEKKLEGRKKKKAI